MKAKILFGSAVNVFFMLCFGWLLLNSSMSIYLLKMGRGQMNIILNTQKVENVLKENTLTPEERERFKWIEDIKRYSVDSLGYKPTRNFTTYFDQKDQPLLWVVTACKPFKFEAYQWKFPLLGWVSYKGFFNEGLAQQEYLRLLRRGYDADLSVVSAWSTLGWLPDPVLSSMLRRSKGRLANLLFHELFHATYYAPGTVEVNENLANFIAGKATRKFLRNDTVELGKYLRGLEDDSVYNHFVFSGYEKLDGFYKNSTESDSSAMLKGKMKLLRDIYFEGTRLKLNNPKRFEHTNREILVTRNAWFMDARRYDGLYDSLNKVLNDKYKGDLKTMINDLKK